MKQINYPFSRKCKIHGASRGCLYFGLLIIHSVLKCKRLTGSQNRCVIKKRQSRQILPLTFNTLQDKPISISYGSIPGLNIIIMCPVEWCEHSSLCTDLCLWNQNWPRHQGPLSVQIHEWLCQFVRHMIMMAMIRL